MNHCNVADLVLSMLSTLQLYVYSAKFKLILLQATTHPHCTGSGSTKRTEVMHGTTSPKELQAGFSNRRHDREPLFSEAV